MKFNFDYQNFFKVIFIINIVFIFLIGFIIADIYRRQDETVEILNEVKEEVKEFNEPYTSEFWALEEIKNWYLEKNVNLESIYGSYIKEYNLPIGFKYVYKSSYKNHAWNITVTFYPTGETFSTCSVYDFPQKWIYCNPTESGTELIKKYG